MSRKLKPNQYSMGVEQQFVLSNHIPHASFIMDNYILTKGGGLQCVIKFNSIDLTSLESYEIEDKFKTLSRLIAELGDNCIINFDLFRERTVDDHSDSNFTSTTTYFINYERDHQCSNRTMLNNSIYFTLTKFIDISIQSEINKYLDQVNYFINNINTAFPSKVSSYLCDRNEAYAFLHKQINKRADVTRCPGNTGLMMMNELLASSNIQFSNSGLQIDDEEYTVLSVAGFPDVLSSNAISSIANSNTEMHWSCRIINLSIDNAVSIINKKESKWRNSISSFMDIIRNKKNQVSVNYAHELSMLKQQIQVERTNGLCLFTSTLFIKKHKDSTGSVTQESSKNLNWVMGEMKRLGWNLTVEGVQLLKSTYLSTIPGNFTYDSRMFPVMTATVPFMMPISGVWTGSLKNPSSEMQREVDGKKYTPGYLIRGFTDGSTPYYLNLHVEGTSAHTMVVGASGSGKSILLTLLTAAFQRYKSSQVFYFDKGYSAYLLNKASAGEIFELGRDNDETQVLNFAPLDALNADVDADIEWGANFIKMLILLKQPTIHFDVSLEKMFKIRLENFLQNNIKGSGRRLLSNFIQSLDLTDNEEVYEILMSYTSNKQKGILDGDIDRFDITRTPFCLFELDNFDKLPLEMQQAVMHFIFFKIDKSLVHSNPTMIVLDEAWVMFKNEFFMSKFMEWIKTLRKKNAFILFATQQIQDLHLNHSTKAVLAECQTKIFLPNANIRQPQVKQYYTEMGLTEIDCSIIANIKSRRDYYIVQNGLKRVIDFKLDNTATLEFLKPADLPKRKQIEQLIAGYGPAWPGEYLKYISNSMIGESGNYLARSAEVWNGFYQNGMPTYQPEMI